MSGAEIQQAFFSPANYILYLFLVLVIMVLYYQWTWAKKCNESIKVLVVKPDGSTDTEYAPKLHGYVSLRCGKDSNATRLWPINKLSAIEELYPGDGFIPKFLQKKIKTVIVDNEDWEPLLNRGSYVTKVASPDVVSVLREIADAHPEAAEELTDLADSLGTAPTREMVASPTVLGNLIKEKVSELAVNMSQEAFDKLDAVMRRLDRLPNPMVLYIGLGIIIVGMVVIIFKLFPLADQLSKFQNIGDILNLLTQIKTALGIKG